ncbi:MAG: rhodanese-like domain-containing protein [Eggerthellaceae bacterium]|jgi:rhodanese-related sulfurtransferase|nr:rhodanese-like domain-containing protein [Eggerthellaceae bacterium]MDR2721423.1 rhodanese-like domain-containing protein [Coriobacteriaceae bacterium]
MGFFSQLLSGGGISAQEAHERIEQAHKQGDKIVVLDVRSAAEYKQVRIKGAKLLPVDEISQRANKELPNKDVPILVYCQSGARASSAVRLLTSMGYEDVVSFGGIIQWPYETTKG